MLPHGYIFVISMTTVFLMANTEINARVASTCPFYFYAWSQVILEAKKEHEEIVKKERVTWCDLLTVRITLVTVFGLYNVITMALNLLLFT